MKNKIAAFCTGIMLLFVPSVIAEEITPLDYESVVFYNSANEEIKEIGNNTSVTAKINLDSAKTGYVLAAQYNENGRMLSGINVEQFDNTADVAAFDMTVDTTNADTVKVFAFEGLTSPEPILSTPGILKTNVVFEKAFPNTDTYLYRVGTEGAVALGKLFKATGTVGDNVDVTIKPIDGNVTVKTTDGNLTSKTINGNVIYKYSASSYWTQSTLDFDGTGVVGVTITDYESTPVTLYIEIVKANNITANSDGVYTNWNSYGNNVLLEDVKISNGGSTSLSGSTLYGNGFTFDVSNGSYEGSDKGQISDNYLISLIGSTLDNVKIVGAVYTEYGATAGVNYNNPVVLSSGNSRIINSYIANCSAPVRVNGGSIEIINSTLKGGNFANLDIRGGKVTLDNVTTINQVNGNDTADDGTIVVGLGIVVYYEGLSTDAEINIKNDITQYNYISETQANTYLKDEYVKKLTELIFNDNAFEHLRYTSGSDVWVNSGIISMSGDVVGDDKISDVDGYQKASTSFLGKQGFVHTKQPDATSIVATVPEYKSTTQDIIEPNEPVIDRTKNILEQEEGSNDYCKWENDTTFVISFDEGDPGFEWDCNILNITKVGKTLDYTVTIDGTPCTDKKLFNEAGEYTVKYTYTDINNYTLKNNRISVFPKEYEKEITVRVNVEAPDTKHAEFTFGSSNTASKTVTINGNNYVMPDVSATSSTIGSTTVNGTTVYYPIREIVMSDGKTSHGSSAWYAYFPVFDGAVTITDYTDGGLGDAVTYGSSTITMPSRLSVVGDPTSLFKYQSSSAAGSSPVVNNNILVYSSPEISADREEYNTVIQYQYTDNAGTTFYYYIGYHAPAQKTCITPETLITLADGSQKEVQYLTGEEELLVWNLETGKYDTAPIVFVDSEEEEEYEVIHLYFSDGTDTEIIYEHGFFDTDLGEYVYIDADNAEQFIGHSFVKQDNINKNTWKTVKLTDVVLETKTTTPYSPVSFSHLCYYVDGMLSMPGGIDGLFNIFEVDTDIMAYDKVQKAKDIETYGLYTYEDFGELIPEIAFEAFNGAYLKVAIGKGMLTWEDIEYLAERYIPLIPTN